MEQNKLVSIVLPVYNGEKYLAESIESVLNQTYKNLELIIVNDCSVDNSLKIAEGYSLKDSRIKIINNSTNLKLPASLNEGFKNASGEYFSWTSDDNYYDITAIEKMVGYLENNINYAMVCCDFYKYDVDTQEKSMIQLNVSPESMINGNCVGACFLYKKDVAVKVGEYNKTKFLVEDYDYWLRVMLEGDIGHISEFLYTYRLHSKSLTGTRMDEILKRTREIQNEYAKSYKSKFNVENIELKNEKMSFLDYIFSIKKINNSKKVVRILGLKITLKIK